MKKKLTASLPLAILIPLFGVSGQVWAISESFSIENDGVTDGGDDQFDGCTLTVNGTAYSGVVSGTVPNFVTAAEAIGNLGVSGQIDLLVPNGTNSADTRDPGLPDFVYQRLVYSISNNGASAATFPVVYNCNLGSNGSTVVGSTSSGDAVITTADLWAVTDDAVNGGPANTGTGQDPAVAFLVADGSGITPTSFFEPFVGSIEVEYSVSLNAGETQSILLVHASRNETDTFTSTPTIAQSQADVVNVLSSPSVLFGGLSSGTQNTLANFSSTAISPSTPTEPEEIPTLGGIVGLLTLITAILGVGAQASRRGKRLVHKRKT
ncbi:MAG: hypothetical protein AAGI88_26235 [Pseudomonadota bacterium]